MFLTAAALGGGYDLKYDDACRSQAVRRLFLDDANLLQFLIEWPLHAHTGFEFERQVIDDPVGNLFSGRDYRNAGRIRRDRFRADAALALLEGHEFRLCEKRIPWKHPHRRNLR